MRRCSRSASCSSGTTRLLPLSAAFEQRVRISMPVWCISMCRGSASYAQAQGMGAGAVTETGMHPEGIKHILVLRRLKNCHEMLLYSIAVHSKEATEIPGQIKPTWRERPQQV